MMQRIHKWLRVGKPDILCLHSQLVHFLEGRALKSNSFKNEGHNAIKQYLRVLLLVSHFWIQPQDKMRYKDTRVANTEYILQVQLSEAIRTMCLGGSLILSQKDGHCKSKWLHGVLKNCKSLWAVV